MDKLLRDKTAQRGDSTKKNCSESSQKAKQEQLQATRAEKVTKGKPNGSIVGARAYRKAVSSRADAPHHLESDSIERVIGVVPIALRHIHKQTSSQHTTRYVISDR